MTTLNDSSVAWEFARAVEGGDTIDKDRMLGELRRKLFDETTALTTIGRFSVLQRLGSGASGVVFAAEDPQLERRVAIKLLRSNSDDTSRQRLIREARTLAKLSHPNIVAVHEVGEHDNRVFLAMELVEGETLAGWIQRGPHPAEEILRVFLEAGRGLAAAHDAGLVHRDFKPANVLLDKQERVRVADFGLARVSSSGSLDENIQRTLSTSGERPELLQELEPGLTQTGALLGTPAYMAPELFGGVEATAQSDQYAFCVALDEAFHQERKYSGRTLPELVANVASGTSTRKNSARLPRRIRRVLDRGLRVDPTKRFASMSALLTELGPRKKSWIWLGPGLLGGAAALGVAVWEPAPEAPCASVGEEVRGLWDAEARGAVQSGFRASGRTGADQYFATVDSRLETVVDLWVETARETCALEHAQTPPSNIEISRRWTCLDHTRVAIDASVELLRTPSSTLVAQSTRILPSLPEIDLCGTDDLLRSGLAAPPAPEQRLPIEELERELKRGRALLFGTERDAAVAALEKTVERARALGHQPTVASALLELGHAHTQLHQSTLALESFLAAALAADRGGADLLRSEALEEASRKQADLGKFEQAHRNLAAAEAVLDRAEVGPGFHRARLETGRAWVAEQEGELSAGLTHFRRAIGLLENAKSHLRAASMTAALNGEAGLLLELGKLEEAVKHYKAAIAYTEAHFGSDYIMLGHLYASLGTAYYNLDRLDLAEQNFTKAREIKRLYVEDDDPLMASLHLNIAGLTFARGDYQGALDHFKVALTAARNGEDSSSHTGLSALANIAVCLSRMGRYDEALESQQTILAERTQLKGPEHIATARARAAVGMTLLKLRRAEEARKPLLTALADTEATVGPEHQQVLWILLGLSEVYLVANEPKTALKTLDRIDALSKLVVTTESELCSMHYGQAQAWRMLGRPREDWTARGEKALEECTASHLDQEATTIQAWLES